MAIRCYWLVTGRRTDLGHGHNWNLSANSPQDQQFLGINQFVHAGHPTAFFKPMAHANRAKTRACAERDRQRATFGWKLILLCYIGPLMLIGGQRTPSSVRCAYSKQGPPSAWLEFLGLLTRVVGRCGTPNGMKVHVLLRPGVNSQSLKDLLKTRQTRTLTFDLWPPVLPACVRDHKSPTDISLVETSDIS